MENIYWTFDHEISKLTHFNCPLKVGITYVHWKDDNGFIRLKRDINQIMQKPTVKREPADTEYLFIIIRGPKPKIELIALIYDLTTEEVKTLNKSFNY